MAPPQNGLKRPGAETPRRPADGAVAPSGRNAIDSAPFTATHWWPSRLLPHEARDVAPEGVWVEASYSPRRAWLPCRQRSGAAHLDARRRAVASLSGGQSTMKLE